MLWSTLSKAFFKSINTLPLSAWKCCLSIFTKIKLLIKNRESSMVFSVVVLLLKCNFKCFVGLQQNLLFSYSFYTTVVNYGLYEPYLLLTNSSFILIFKGMFIIWVKFVEIPKQYLEASLMPSTRSLISDKARCFSHSERALYENFIINLFKYLSILSLTLKYNIGIIHLVPALAELSFVCWEGNKTR